MRDFGEHSQHTRDERGQTTIDFGIGVSVFLVTVLFVFLFLPSLFTPFVSDQSVSITADRSADRLTADLLHVEGDRGQSQYVLDSACTLVLFEQFESANTTESNSHAPEDCEYTAFEDTDIGPYPSDGTRAEQADVEEEYLQHILGLSDTTGVRVSIEPVAADEPTADRNYARISNINLRAGPPVPQHGNIVVAQRVVHMSYTEPDGSIHQEDFMLVVRMW